MPNQPRVIAILTARPGKSVELEALLGSMRNASRAEQGNLRYDFLRDRSTAGRFVLDEVYTDDAALDNHLASKHFQSYAATIGDLADRIAMVVDPVEVG
jgi:quinol monooxygenase YgiN